MADAKSWSSPWILNIDKSKVHVFVAQLEAVAREQVKESVRHAVEDFVGSMEVSKDRELDQGFE
jgi:hypothetical protein